MTSSFRDRFQSAISTIGRTANPSTGQYTLTITIQKSSSPTAKDIEPPYSLSGTTWALKPEALNELTHSASFEGIEETNKYLLAALDALTAEEWQRGWETALYAEELRQRFQYDGDATGQWLRHVLKRRFGETAIDVGGVILNDIRVATEQSEPKRTPIVGV